MAGKLLTLDAAVGLLGRHYGPPARPPTADPFELILLENVAYLAPPARRRDAFEHLKRTVGTSPTAILSARLRDLESVTARGILKGTFAAKLRECARIAIEDLGGDLRAATRGPLGVAVRALRKFPGIGEPGAEKLLLFAGRHALLAPDSNGLRVLVRLGLVREDKSYGRTYAASRLAAEGLPADTSVMQNAHLLLHHHGQTLCRRSSPRCGECPLAQGCAHARRARRAPHRRPPRGSPDRDRAGRRPSPGRGGAERRGTRAGEGGKMDLVDCRALLGHAEWADALVWKSVQALALEDSELREKLHHLHMVQWAYLHIWRAEAVKPRELSTLPTLAAIRAWAREYYGELPSYLAPLSERTPAHEVRFPWADRLVQRFGGAQPATWAESVLQVAMHTSYHRGQVARRLRQLEVEPPLSDFVAWIWMGRPAADWGDDEAA